MNQFFDVLFYDNSEVILDADIDYALKSVSPMDFSRCPYCNSIHIYKNGRTKLGRQRYYCRNCTKSFSETTGSPLMYSKKPLELWAKYLVCIKKALTLRTAASLLNISVSTSFFWRHKILSVFGKSFNNTKLSNTIEINELKLVENFKGNHSVKPNIFSNGRNYVMILSCLDSCENKLFRTSVMNRVGRLDKEALDIFLAPSIENGKIIVVSRNDKYINFAKHYKMKICMVGSYNYIIPGLNTKRAVSQSSMFKRFIKQFSSVASKYLSFYINWFRIKTEHEKITLGDMLDKFMNGKRQLRVHEFNKIQFDGSLTA